MRRSRQFEQQREALFDLMGDAGVAIVPAARVVQRNADVDYPFRQDSDFYLLTGMEEPDAVAVFCRTKGQRRFVLFVRERDPEKERWDGERPGVEGAVRDYGADEAYPLGALGDKLPELFEGARRVAYRPGRYADLDSTVFAAWRHHRSSSRVRYDGPDELINLEAVTEQLRLRKSPAALDALRRAARISALGHREAMRVARPGLYEFQVEAVLDFAFKAYGAVRHGYTPIVASGANATVLHYVRNDRRMEDGDLLLVDAGGEFDFHTADITRTFPVSGRFTPPQRDAYAVVLAAQRAAMARCVVGASMQEVHETAVRVLVEGMVALGLLEGDVDGLIEREAYKPYYMHRTGHWLGMDVHDVGRYWSEGQSRRLEPNMVVTVEPGLYVPLDAAEAPEALRGIGIRIEDDVLVTDDGPVVLTEHVPTDPDEIEALCAEPSSFADLLPLLDLD